MTLTPALQAVALWASVNTLVLIWISVTVGGLRGKLKVSIGDGGEPRMIRALRGQANFAENVPIALILLFLMAFIGAPALVVHLFGAALTVGRIAHGVHFLAEDAPGWQRMLGALLTNLVLFLAALGLIGHTIFSLGTV